MVNLVVVVFDLLLPDSLREILPINTGIGYFFSAGIAAMGRLSFALVYRLDFSRIDVIIE